MSPGLLELAKRAEWDRILQNVSRSGLTMAGSGLILTNLMETKAVINDTDYIKSCMLDGYISLLNLVSTFTRWPQFKHQRFPTLRPLVKIPKPHQLQFHPGVMELDKMEKGDRKVKVLLLGKVHLFVETLLDNMLSIPMPPKQVIQ